MGHWGWGCPLVGPISRIGTSEMGLILGYINYFVPISEIIATTLAWVTAIGVYYGVSIILRWAKAIS